MAIGDKIFIADKGTLDTVKGTTDIIKNTTDTINNTANITKTTTDVINSNVNTANNTLNNGTYGLNAIKTSNNTIINNTTINNSANKNGVLSQKEAYIISLLEDATSGLNAIKNAAGSSVSSWIGTRTNLIQDKTLINIGSGLTARIPNDTFDYWYNRTLSFVPRVTGIHRYYATVTCTISGDDNRKLQGSFKFLTALPNIHLAAISIRDTGAMDAEVGVFNENFDDFGMAYIGFGNYIGAHKTNVFPNLINCKTQDILTGLIDVGVSITFEAYMFLEAGHPTIIAWRQEHPSRETNNLQLTNQTIEYTIG